MDRQVILAVAGSGKTTFLVNSLDDIRRFLIVSYTDNNVAHLRRCIIDKFGYMPKNITLLSYFQFLIRVCYRPFLKDAYKAKGIKWDMPEAWTRCQKDKLHYMTRDRYLYHNRLAKLCMNECKDLIRDRLNQFYDCFMFDEVQDLGGHDFNLIQSIIPTKTDCLFVGDFYQHTFETSNDGNTNSSLYNNYDTYKKKWTKIGMTIDKQTLSNSYRCSPTVCEFVKNHLSISICSHRKDETSICYENNQEEADELFRDNFKVKLFYQEAAKYNCFSENWGKSKGLDDFTDVCIILNAKTLKAYKKGILNQLSSSTRNKLYVAFTRAKGNVYLIPHTFTDKYKR